MDLTKNRLTKPLPIALAIALTMATEATVKAERSADVQMELRTNRKIYHMGETVTFVMTFRNTSGRSLRIFPGPEQNGTRVISLANLASNTKPKPLQLVELSTYFDSWARETVTVKPGQTCRHTLKAVFRDRLPPDWENPNRGIYLIFYGGTAFQLPEFGKYSVSGTYRFDDDHPVVNYISRNGPRLWFGNLISESVIVALEK
jgi:hypothetical protein